MTKRFLALLLAVAMIVTVFAGCKKSPSDSSNNVSVIYETEYEYVKGDGTVVESADDGENGDGDSTNKNSNSNKNGTSSSNKNSTSSSNKSGTSSNKNNTAASNKNGTTSGNSATVTASSNTNKTGFPIVKKKETISVMTQYTAGLGNFSDSEFTKVYEKMTNMDIEWQLVLQSEIKSKVTLALQSGNLPDIITGTILDDEDMLQYSSEGTFVEITKDLLQEWAPNIYATYNENPEAWEKTVTSDGKMYAISGFSKDWNYAQHYFWVRTSWLKKLGISKPKTMDEFYNMLTAFRDNDPNGNGKKDEVPFATWSSSGFIYNPWGFIDVIDVTTKGKVTNMYTTDNMKNAVAYWAKIYKEGLVDKNSINNYAGSNAAFHTLINSGKVGCFFIGYPQEDNFSSLSEYEILQYPTAGNNGDFPSIAINVNPITDIGRVIITKSCSNVTAALRWLDYLYTDDGYMLRKYGEDGGYYKKVSNTEYKLTGNKESDNAGPSWALMGKDYLSVAKITNQTPSFTATQRANIDAWCESTLKTNSQKFLPTTWKTKDEINAEKLYTPYWNEVKTMDWQFIQGKKNMGSDWTTLINEMSAKGMNKYIAVLQNYYDRCN